jgi:hypothetical protein
MRKYAPTLSVLLMIASAVMGQGPEAAKSADPATPTTSTISAPPAITANSTPLELARAALAAQGGNNFKKLRSMMLLGSANLYAPNNTNSIPGKFAMVTVGDKVYIDIDARPMFSFKQIYDGQQSFSSLPGVQLPPASKFGLPVLTKFDQPGYTVSALPDKKRLRGFRIVDAEENTTDFYIDPATARVMQYLTPYNGYTFGTENSKFKEVEGVLVPFNFTQRLETPQGVFFAEYKVKEAKLNQPVSDELFVMQ